MEITTRKEKNVVIVSVKGKMDAVTCHEFERRMIDVITEGESDFIIDFGGLDYISSSGLRSIIIIAKKLETKKGRLSLSALRDLVEEVFTISGFANIFPIYDSVESALKTDH